MPFYSVTTTIHNQAAAESLSEPQWLCAAISHSINDAGLYCFFSGNTMIIASICLQTSFSRFLIP